MPSESRGWFVYIYKDELGKPYYVGQGRWTRIRSKQAHELYGIQVPPESRIKIKRLRTQWEAWGLEMLLIRKWGLRSDGGLLVNKTLGGAYGSLGIQRHKDRVKEMAQRRSRRIREQGMTPGERKALAALSAKRGTATQLWRITWQDGRVEMIWNLKKFCEETGYNHPCLSALSRGQRSFHRDIVKVEKISETRTQLLLQTQLS